MKSEKFPVTVSKLGVSARIRKTIQFKNGQEYTAYVAEYNLLGKRTREWRSDLGEAKRTALEACRKIAKGEHLVLTLKNDDRLEYIRAKEALAPVGVPLDSACREFAQAVALLNGVGSLTEAAQVLVKRRFNITNKSVPDAVNELIAQIETEQRNTTNGTRRKDAWLKLLRSHLQNKFARDFNCAVAELSSAILEPWLVGLTASERTRSNIRDCVAFFLKWAKGRNYLQKDADPLANVQKFRKRKRGAVKVLSPDELRTLLAESPTDFTPYLALRAFAGLRDSEARALECMESLSNQNPQLLAAVHDRLSGVITPEGDAGDELVVTPASANRHHDSPRRKKRQRLT